MNRRLKILVVWPTNLNAIGGAEGVIKYVLTRLQIDHGAEIQVIDEAGDKKIQFKAPAELSKYKIGYESTNFFNTTFLSIPDLRTILHIVFSSSGFDCCILYPYSLVLTLILALTLRCPIMIDLHNPDYFGFTLNGRLKSYYKLQHQLRRVTFKILAQLFWVKLGIHVFNNFYYQTLMKPKFFKFCDRDAIFLIPNGVDLDKFHPSEEFPPEFNVLYVCRMDFRKGIDVMQIAINKINKIKESINFWLIGPLGLPKEKIQALIDEINLIPNVSYFGRVENELFLDLFQRASIFVAPYRYESFPLTVLEAQACGLPVVGSRIPGIIDAVIDLKENEKCGTGLLFEVEDADALVGHITDLYKTWRKNPEKFKIIRENAKRHSENFNVIKVPGLYYKALIQIADMNSAKVLSRNKKYKKSL